VDNANEEVMFQIGVMEHPQTASRLKALADSVERYQQSMSASVEMIGKSAGAVKDSLSSLTEQIKVYRSETLAAASEIRSAMSQIEAVAAKRASNTVGPSVASVGSGPTRTSSRGALGPGAISAPDVGSMFSEVSQGAVDAETKVQSLRERIEAPLRFGDGLDEEMTQVLEDLVDIAHQEALKIQSAIDHATSGGVDSVQEDSQRLRQEYANTMLASSEAYSEMARDVTAYAAKHGSVSEKIIANVASAEKALHTHRDAQRDAAEAIDKATVKGLRSVVLGAKGIAELGLMSEQSAQKFMQSMAVIQGAFDIFEGGAELLEAFSDGWKAVRKASDAAASAQKLQSAMQSAQFAQFRAYHALLAQETLAANSAAAANARLAASRSAPLSSLAQAVVPGAARGAALSAGSAAAGSAASSAIAGGAAAGGAGAAASGFVATGVAGVVTTLAAVAAAAGALALVLYEIGEIATGYADKQKSVTNTIASTEVSIAAGALRLTGAFEKSDSVALRWAQSFSSAVDVAASSVPVFGQLISKVNLLGDVAALAASQAGVERAEKRLARDRIVNQANFDRKDAISSATREKQMADFQLFASESRDAFSDSGQSARVLAAQATQEEQARLVASLSLARSNRTLDEYRMGGNVDPNQLADAKQSARDSSQELIFSARRQQSIAGAKGDGRLSAEKEIELRATAELVKQQTLLSQMKQGLVGTEQELLAAEQAKKYWTDQVTESLGRQRQIQNESATERLAAEKGIQDVLRNQIDSQTASIQALRDQYRSAASNFSKLGDIEKDFAKQAIEQARAKGASSLTDQQRDLLRQVGTSEANRFAEQADQAEAKRFGFDQTFGSSIEAERKGLETTRATLEAELKTSYEVAVTMQFDTAGIVGQVTEQVGVLMAQNNESLKEQIDRKLQDRLGEIQQKASLDLRAKKQGQKG
jgi:hypothetical protein